MKRYILQDYSSFIAQNSSFAVQNLTTETQFLVGNIFLPTVTLISELALISLVLCILVYFVPEITMMLIFLLLLNALLLNRSYKKVLTNLGANRLICEQQRVRSLKEVFDNFAYVRVSATESFFADRHKALFHL